MQFPFIVLEVSERKLQDGTRVACSLSGRPAERKKSHGLPHSRSPAEQKKGP